METYICIVAADEDEVEALAESAAPLDEWSGVDGDGFDTMKLVTLHCLLTGDSLQAALDRYEPVFVADDETSILRLADDFCGRLAGLEEEELETMAYEAAASDEFERAQWVAEDVLERLAELCDLAQLAESQGQSIFVWMRTVDD